MLPIDLKIRSWTKSFTWRILGVIILLPLTYIFTGKWESAAALTLAFHLLRMLLFYYHERLWERVSWGRNGNSSNNTMFWFFFWLIILIITFIVTAMVSLW